MYLHSHGYPSPSLSPLQSYQNGHSGSPQELPHIIPSFDSEESLQAQDLMLFISHVAAGLVREQNHFNYEKHESQN